MNFGNRVLGEIDDDFCEHSLEILDEILRSVTAASPPKSSQQSEDLTPLQVTLTLEGLTLDEILPDVTVAPLKIESQSEKRD